MRKTLFPLIICAVVTSACQTAADATPTSAGSPLAPTPNEVIVTLAQPPTTTPDPNNPPPTRIVETSGPTDIPTRTLDPVMAVTHTAIVIDAATAGASFGTPELPIAGTAIISQTQDPNAGLLFDRIIFSIDANGAVETVEVLQSGQVVRNGQAGIPLNGQQVTELDAILDEINYFGLSGIFQAMGGGRRGTTFTITVERAGESYTIVADDNFTPPELRRLFTVLINAGQQRPG